MSKPAASAHMITFSFAGNEYQTKRLIGEFGNDQGPTFVLTGGIHGNEPTGVIAIQQVLAELAGADIQLDGRVIGLAGNLNALRQNIRFDSSDLNRIWNDDFIQRWSKRSTQDHGHGDQEAAEQRELFSVIEPLLKEDRFRRIKGTPPQLYFADLHTTSSKSIPFIGINDQIDNRDFALKFPAPIILGLEEHLTGPFPGLINDQGHVALSFEAGQHDDPQSVENHKSFIFLALIEAGIIPEAHRSRFDVHRRQLESICKKNHGIFEVTYRKDITDQDQFSMEPGFDNFTKIQKGQLLARDRTGLIHAHQYGRIFMPLYQQTGSDGYFIVRDVPGWALTLSRFLRRVNFEKLLVLLPGVARSSQHPDALVIDKRTARFLALQLFHLLGYRRKRDSGEKMTVIRREISQLV